MAANNTQKIALLNIDANTENTIKNYLLQGYYIHFIVSLLPTYTKLLVIYSIPEPE